MNLSGESIRGLVDYYKADEESELISIYYGSDVTEEDAEKLLALVKEACPGCEVELNRGGQPIYYYLMSVE